MTDHNFFKNVVKVSKNLGFIKTFLYFFVWIINRSNKVFDFFRFKIFSSFSEKYNSSNIRTNSLFNYREFKNFRLLERKNLLKNKIKIFSKNPSNYSIIIDNLKYDYLKNINYSNRKKSFIILKKISKYYKKKVLLTNWKLDGLNQYTWNHKVKDYVGYNQGYDIKVPWELARLQHLNKHCLFAKLNKTEDFNFIKAQVFDFISSNPPIYGLHWFNAMEVAIRGANLSMITDILISENKLDKVEKLILLNSINDHLLFVINNLEWSPLSRSNHYIANIVGLLVMSYFLPKDDFLESIIKFSCNQLLNEIDFQFYDDGGSKEGSTAYHIFSSEMILVGLYFLKKIRLRDSDFSYKLKLKNLMNLPTKTRFIYMNSVKIKKKIEKKFFNKVNKILKFSKILLRNNNTLLQVGDNDSGCFFDFDFSDDSLERKKLHILLSEDRKGSLLNIIKKFL